MLKSVRNFNAFRFVILAVEEQLPPLKSIVPLDKITLESVWNFERKIELFSTYSKTGLSENLCLLPNAMRTLSPLLNRTSASFHGWRRSWSIRFRLNDEVEITAKSFVKSGSAKWKKLVELVRKNMSKWTAIT